MLVAGPAVALPRAYSAIDAVGAGAASCAGAGPGPAGWRPGPGALLLGARVAGDAARVRRLVELRVDAAGAVETVRILFACFLIRLPWPPFRPQSII